MRKLQLLLLLALAAAGQVHAQDAGFFRWESAHYQVLADESEAAARETAAKLEGAFQLFSGYFHFDPAQLPARMRVRIFRAKGDFDAYLGGIVSENRQDFVLVSYADPQKGELLGFRREPAEFDVSLLHQGFIQYLKAFVPGAPVWLQAGMATFLERSAWDPETGTFRPKINLSWLPLLRAVLRGESGGPRWSVAELAALKRNDAVGRLEAFYPQAWGLVHFLVHSEDRRYNRALWDAISALDPAASAEDNAARVYARAFSWLDETTFRRDYEAYIFAQKTFAERVQEGFDLYGQDRLKEAEESFRRALELQADHYLPHYYLGLIDYARKDFPRAAAEYQKAQALGAEPGLVLYALGVNAFADRQYEAAEGLLRQAAGADPAAYGDKVESLLKRIEALK